MIRKSAIIAIVILGLSFVSMVYYQNYATNTLINNRLSFGPGEVIKYRAHYGFLNAAIATMHISDTYYKLNDQRCMKIEILGESVGMFNLMLNIEDVWGTYFSPETLLPQRYWRKLKEGKYRKHEIVDFDQEEHKARVITYNFKSEEWREPKMFDIPVSCQDMVSGYYFLRTLDMEKLSKGDTIIIDGFFDDETYNFKIRYLGRDMVKTKIGKYNAHFFSPIMPKNSLFDGENSIKFWLSDDQFKIPLKIKADMFVGAVEIDILEYSPSK